MRTYIQYWLAALFACFVSSLTAQISTDQISSKGSEFWLAFMPNAGEYMNDGSDVVGPTETYVYITAETESHVIVRMPAQGLSFDESGTAFTADQVLTVPAGSSIQVLIPYAYSIINPTGNVDDLGGQRKDWVSEVNDDPRGIQVVSLDNEVSVYGLNSLQYSADAALIYPIDALGDHVLVMTQGEDDPMDVTRTNAQEMIVVATEDATNVEITLAAESIGGVSAGSTISVQLDAGEVYQIQSMGDLTGTVVNANCKPVAVFGGNSFTGVPSGEGFRDVLYEQNLPTIRYGRRYVVAPYLTRKLSDSYKLMATADNTEITIFTNTAPRTFTLNKGEYRFEELPIVDGYGYYIEATQPIMLAHFSNSLKVDNITDEAADPFMDIMPSIEQSVNEIVFNVFEGASVNTYYINIVTLRDNVDNITLDGTPIGDRFVDGVVYGNEAYSVARFSISQGNHILQSSGKGFLANVYGYERRESYGYIAGSSARDIILDFDLNWADTRYNHLDFKDTVCLNDSLEFFAIERPDVEIYKWVFNETETVTGNSARFVADYVGEIDIQLIGARTSNCETVNDTLRKKIIISDVPDVDLQLSDTICRDEQPEVTVFPEGGEFYFGLDTFDVFPSHVLDTGDNVFVYKYTNTFQCSNTDTAVVHVRLMPETIIDYINTGRTDSIDVLLDAGGNYDSYLWSTGATSSSIVAKEAGDYSVTVSIDGCEGYDTVNVPIIPLMVLSPDDTICRGDTAMIAARTNGFDVWTKDGKEFSRDDTVYIWPDVSGDYVARSWYIANDHLINEDFENGNDGFNSEYGYSENGIGFTKYIIGKDAYDAAPAYFFHLKDHTSGEGNMMIVDGGTEVGVAVFEDTVNVVAGETYSFSVWMASVHNGYKNPPYLEFSINGNQVGVLDADSLPEWRQFYTIWEADVDGEIIVRIENANTEWEGNDFVLDDIQFSKVEAELYDTVHIEVQQPFETFIGNDTLLCEGDSLQLVSEIGDGYLWNTADTSRSISVDKADTYSVRVERGKCADTASIMVDFTPPPDVSFDLTDTVCFGVRPEVLVNELGGYFSMGDSVGLDFPYDSLHPGMNVFSYTRVSDIGCTTTVIDSVFVRDNPQITIEYINEGIEDSISVILNAGDGYDSYEWSTGSTQQIIRATAAGYYSVTVSQGGCLGYDEVYVPIVPYLHVSPDDTICRGDTAMIAARTNGFTIWTVNGNELSRADTLSVTPDVTTEYVVHSWYVANEFLLNEDFENGNTGFHSEYNYITDDNAFAPNNYTIRPDSYNQYFLHINDHTSGSGSMMVVDGGVDAGMAVFEDTVSVIEGELYSFSTWIASIHNNYDNPPYMQFTIGGVPLGILDADSLPEWRRFFTIWEANVTGEVIVRIENENTLSQGNDFVLDDIQFAKIEAELLDTILITVEQPFEINLGNDTATCVNDTIALLSEIGDSYVWSTGDSLQGISVTETDTYSVVVERGKCKDTALIEVTFHPLPEPVFTLTDTICAGTRPEVYVDMPGGMFIFNGQEYAEFPFDSLNQEDNIFEYAVTDANGCSAVVADTVFVRELPQVVISYIDQTDSDSVKVELNAGDGFDAYVWNTGSDLPVIVATEAGYYSVEVNNKGCIGYDTVYVPIVPFLHVSEGDTVCRGDTASIAARTNGIFEWTVQNTHFSENDTLAVTPSKTVNYIARALFSDHVALLNETFENGNRSFRTDYSYVASGSIASSQYTLLSDSRTGNASGYFSVNDHTSGSGNMMLVNGTASGGVAVFEDTVAVLSGNTYVFSAWIASVMNNYTKPPSMTFTVNGRQVGEIVADSLPRWSQFFGLWNADVTGEAIVRIECNSLLTVETAFAIDDIQFAELIHEIYDTVQIVVDQPFELFLGDDADICPTDSILLDAGLGDTYLWSTGDTVQSIIADTVDVYSVVVSRGLCVEKDTIAVGFIPMLQPAVDFVASDTAICAGTRVDFEVNLEENLGINPEFIWYVNNEQAGTGRAFSSTQLPDSAVVMLAALSNESCITDDTVDASKQMTVFPLLTPFIAIHADTLSVCEGDTISFSIDSIANQGTAPVYQWYVNNQPISSDTAFRSHQFTDGDKIKLQISSNEECLTQETASDELAVEINAYPEYDLGTDTSLCFWDKMRISLPAGFDFEWSDNHSSSFRDVVQPGGKYYSRLTSDKGCTTADSIVVDFYDTVAFAIEGYDKIYANTSVELNVNHDFASYKWQNGKIAKTIEETLQETTDFTVLVFDQHACPDTAFKTVEVLPRPLINIPDVSFCEGDSAVLTVSADFDEYDWKNLDTDTKSITVSETGTYIIEGKIIGQPSLSVFDTVDVRKIPLPEFTMSEPKAFCEGASDIIGTEADDNHTYRWNTGHRGNSMTVTASGMYVLTVTAEGCSSSDSVQVTVYPRPAKPIAPDYTLCYYDSLPLITANGDSIYWYADDGLSQLIDTGGFFNTADYVNGLLPEGDTLALYLQAKGLTCNSAVEKVSVFRRKMETNLQILADSTIFCEGTYDVPFAVSGVIDSLEWQQEGARINHLDHKILHLDFLQEGFPMLYVETVDRFGCWYYDSLELTVLRQPDAAINLDLVNGKGYFENISVNPEEDSVQYFWMYYGSGGWEPALARDTVMKYQYGWHGGGLKAINNLGCVNYDRRDFFVDLPFTLMVPNAFAPDNPAPLVSHFKAVGMNLKVFKMWIYDVWGNTVWYTENLDEDGQPSDYWDGTYKGTPLKADCYTWKIYAQFVNDDVWEGIEQENGKFKDTGSVMLLR